ncbi:amidase domain-containing protein [Bacillus pinisoli]|uniref:amidase domain-containing protein n=1 Tax=Bacillus pinisoli TaxID=2901866 RepID=UPI001FF3541A|nr:amidase domain-containing protein [Bacillus pinisoli]
MNVRKVLETYISGRVHANVGRQSSTRKDWNQRYRQLKEREALIVKSQALCEISKIEEVPNGGKRVHYSVRFMDLIKQNNHFVNEENVEERVAFIQHNQVVDDQLITNTMNEEPFDERDLVAEDDDERAPFIYDRRAAVQYAEQWWDSYNPQFKKFEVDCTNFISQCLHAGGASMTGYPNRGKGWWMKNGNWSYSWSVANALRRYLPNAKSGVRAIEKNSAAELSIGDVICYDFEGDGKFNHNTIVVAKDRNNMPLVNAHTHNSRMRYWSYTDSTAYTPNIKYAFLHIVDDRSK